MRKKLIEQAKLFTGTTPTAAVAAGDVNGIIIDRFGYLSAITNVGVGAASGTPTAQSITYKLQHGDASNGSDMADVASTNVLKASVALTADSSSSNASYDLTGLKRYIRLVTTVAFTDGSTPKQLLHGSVVLGDSVVEPV
jgi:hypothetical protein